MRLEKDGIRGSDIARRGCAGMEMEGMVVLLEEGVGGVVGMEEVQVKFGVVGLCKSIETCGDLDGLVKNQH